MGLVVAAEQIFTGDQSTTPPTFFHRFTPTIFLELKAVRLWVVKYGTPTLDALGCELRSYDSVGGGRTLIQAAQNVWQLSEISSDNYGVKEVYFDWLNPILLKKGVEYTINLTLDNYVGDATNHIAWVRAWPDPIVAFSGSTTYINLNKFPFQVGLIGREVRP